ncbi:MAG: hypothetical protein RL148_2248 [Planctomycetota bacterium]
MNRSFLLAASVFLAVASSASAQVVLSQIAEVDVQTSVVGNIGNNPSAIAFDGTNLYVAGFYNGSPGTTGQSAMVKISNVLTTPTVGTLFGIDPVTPASRGYSGLDWHNGFLYAAFDPGSVNANGITCWDANGTQVWAKSARGGSSVARDPGVPGGNPAFGTGIAWTQFAGSAGGPQGRALQDALTGLDIWGLQTGFSLSSPTAQYFRDMDFDDQTGDLWYRANNNLYVARRTGDNAATTAVVALDPETTPRNMQNVVYVRTPTGSVVLYNDRDAAVTGQLFVDVMRAMRPDGTPDRLDLGTFSPLAGSAAYDFAYHEPTQVLAISDFTNRKVYFFNVTVPPSYGYGAGCADSSSFVPRHTSSGTLLGGSGVLTLQVDNATPAAPAFFAFGFGKTQIPLGNGCDILVGGLSSFFLGPVFTAPGLPGSGAASAPFAVPPGYSGVGFNTQAVVLDNGAIVLSNGLQTIIP